MMRRSASSTAYLMSSSVAHSANSICPSNGTTASSRVGWSVDGTVLAVPCWVDHGAASPLRHRHAARAGAHGRRLRVVAVTQVGVERVVADGVAARVGAVPGLVGSLLRGVAEAHPPEVAAVLDVPLRVAVALPGDLVEGAVPGAVL